MNRFLTSALFLVALAIGVMPAGAATIPTYTTYGSNAEVFLTPTSSGEIGYPPNTNYSLNEVMTFGNTSGGHYGQAYTYIPFTVSGDGFITATVSDLKLTDAGANPLKWLNIALYEYTGSGMSYLGCGNGSSLCTELAYDAHPPTASVASALFAGTQYLLRVGFGLCGCSGEYGGINLTVATTPIPGALLLFVSALMGMGGFAWQRRRSVDATA